MNREEEKRKLIKELNDTKSQKDSLIWDIEGGPDEHIEHHEDTGPYAEIEDLSRKEKKINEEIRKLEIEEENEIKINRFNKNLINEAAIIDKESNVDLLGRDSQAKAIARLISNKQTVAPLTIGIYGSWGRGKSTFVQLIQNNLNKINKDISERDYSEENDYNKSYIVKFNPTEYDDHKMIWYAILKELYMKYDKETGFKGRMAFAFRNLTPSFRSNKLAYFISSILLILNVLVFVYLFNSDSSLSEVIRNSKLYATILTFGLFITTIAHVLVPLFKKLSFIIKPLSSKMLEHMLIPNYKEKLGTREEVKDSLDDLLRIWLKQNEKIVLIVDELDRCSENTIVEFFSAIQLFISSNSIIKIISMNDELVALALANNNNFIIKEGATRKEKLEFGHEYLKKYISIPIHLGPIVEYRNYVKALLGNELSFFDLEEKETIIKLIDDISRIKDLNPREIKRIINLLILSKENVVTQFDSLSYKITFSEYIKWFFVNYFNPIASSFFIRNIKETFLMNEYKYMEFRKMYPLFLQVTKAKKEQTISYLSDSLDMKIEVIVEADNLMKKSLIR